MRNTSKESKKHRKSPLTPIGRGQDYCCISSLPSATTQSININVQGRDQHSYAACQASIASHSLHAKELYESLTCTSGRAWNIAGLSEAYLETVRRKLKLQSNSEAYC